MIKEALRAGDKARITETIGHKFPLHTVVEIVRVEVGGTCLCRGEIILDGRKATIGQLVYSYCLSKIN